MTKKVCCLLTTLAVLLSLAVPVAAESAITDITPRESQNTTRSQSAENGAASSTPKLPILSDLNLQNFTAKTVQENDLSGAAESVNGHYPVNVDATEQEGVVRLTKTFLVAEGVQPDVLTEPNLMRNGVSLKLTDVVKKDLPGDSAVKPVSDTKSVQGKDKEAAKAALPATLDYSKDGYTGVLTLDSSTVTVVAEGEEPYSFAVTETKTYRRIPRNDPVLLEKTIDKNGATLSLQTVQWTDVGKGDGSVAGPFDAVATYKGVASGVKAKGYVATGTYTGDAMSVEAGQTEFTLIYEGSLPAPVTAAEVTEKVEKVFPIGKMLAGLGIFLLTGGGVVGGIWWWKRRKNRMDDDEPEPQPTSHANPYDNRAGMDRPRVLDELNRGGEDD